MQDLVAAGGIRIHKYGPHYFRCSVPRIWEYVNRFDSFYSYEAVVKSTVDERLEDWPVNRTYLERAGLTRWQPGHSRPAANFEEACLQKMPQLVYDKFVKGYTEKQWGVKAVSLSPALADRVELRRNGDPRLTPGRRFQGLPERGYSRLLQRMLEGIPQVLNCDYLHNRRRIRYRRWLIYTGPIDDYFAGCYGRLTYRGQQRRHYYFPDIECYQPSVQINNPDPAAGPHIRTIEWKHLASPEQVRGMRGTLITRETPFTPTVADNYEYPFPDVLNRDRYDRYRKLADRITGVLICGRLGEYRYYDMDQAIARAMKLTQTKLLD